MIALQENTSTQRVCVVQLVRRVGLQRVGHVLFECVLRNAIEQDIAERVRHEVQARITCSNRSLHIERTLRVLPAQDGKVIQFTLIFIERIAGVAGLTVYAERRTVGVGDARHLVATIRNLKFARGTRQHGAQAVALIENVFQVCKLMILRGVIVVRARAAVRRLDTQIIA